MQAVACHPQAPQVLWLPRLQQAVQPELKRQLHLILEMERVRLHLLPRQIVLRLSFESHPVLGLHLLILQAFIPSHVT
jgi:hypothetical protein